MTPKHSSWHTKFRIRTDNYCGYEVQVWNIWWPFWRQYRTTNTHYTFEQAKRWLDVNHNSELL